MFDRFWLDILTLSFSCMDSRHSVHSTCLWVVSKIPPLMRHEILYSVVLRGVILLRIALAPDLRMTRASVPGRWDFITYGDEVESLHILGLFASQGGSCHCFGRVKVALLGKRLGHTEPKHSLRSRLQPRSLTTSSEHIQFTERANLDVAMSDCVQDPSAKCQVPSLFPCRSFCSST